ncbi:apoptosis-antagonizing transcription factor [Kockovaella imperatae]|uniref:Protein BFR2 n=1 Tax=Kockovaella imperatae TaxID=4999 RepID=A0A1Y1UPC4_9TREE|nr:apoptosis-antagonizing transcription factor [Kockovaella imperatae]ORX39417.1 apoptosis-antagonizing transcription factor [Kockovaella imperatae]
MSRPTLRDQLRALEDDDEASIDPENAYSSLDTVRIGQSNRDDYMDVGPSRLRGQLGDANQVLLGDKYAGTTVTRNKIFDDDEDEEQEGGGEDADSDDEEDESEDLRSEQDAEVEDHASGQRSGSEEDEGEDEESDGSNNDDEEEEEEDDDDDDEHDEDDPNSDPQPKASSSRLQASNSLDPVGALRAARAKDIERGRGIKRQKALFDGIVALRITFQKALAASNNILSTSPEHSQRKAEALDKLLALSDDLFELRKAILLPGTDTEEVADLGKRKRADASEDLLQASNDSLRLAEAQHSALVSILTKWYSKIQAATINVASKAAGSSKFLQSTKGQQSIVEVIQAGLSQAAGTTFMEHQEAGYRSLLREVIETRSVGGPDLSHLRREKKKKREAERGGSKGRKLRYTVHEKAQHFAVPVPLRDGWHEEQIDELFSSLLGGAGLQGAGTEGGVLSRDLGVDRGLTDLGGLRVF